MAGGNSNLPSWARAGSGGGGNPNLPSWAAPKPAPTVLGARGHNVTASKTHGGFAHWLANKLELAATDVKNTPGGLVQLGKVPVHEAKATYFLATGNTKAANKELNAGHNESKTIVHSTVEGTKQTVKHPLADPFQTFLLGATAFSAGGSLAGRAAAVGRAAGEGTAADILKAAVKKPAVKPRFLSKNGEQTPIQASKNPSTQAVQAVHDRVVQKAIDKNPDSRLAGYGTKRIGGSQDETARYQARLRSVPAAALQRAASKLNGKLPGHIRTRAEQAALELTSVNTAPEDAAAFHRAQAAKGVEPARNEAVAKLYDRVAEKGMLTKNSQGDVIVDAGRHPLLAKADVALAKVQGRGDEILTRYGIRTPEDLQAAIDKPGRYRAGAIYEKPTPAKNGVVSQAEVKAQARVTRLQTLFDRVTAAKPVSPGEPPLAALKAGVASTPRGVRIGGALSVAKDDLERIQKAAKARVKPTGVIGGETARPGRGFVSYRGQEAKAPKNTAAASAGPVIGETKAPISNHVNTGANIGKGFVPKDVTGMAARHYQQIVRFQNTSERRAAAIRSGAPVKQTSRDVLVKVPGASHEKISPAVNEILGKSKLTSDDLEGLNAALQDYKANLVPGLRDHFAKDRADGIGTPAPEGHVWVDRNILGDLGKPAGGPRGRIARAFNNVNSAVTAATVYFKVGHVGTRALTNAATAIIHGSAEPTQIGRSLKLWKTLDDNDRMRALAAAGQHGFEAMPHEGVSLASTVAGKGAMFWARRFDAPFRFNAIAHEARKAGFDTPAKFRTMLDQAEDPAGHGLNAAQHAKVDWVLKRANREMIAYDRLSPFERQYIGRALWFYPWLRGTANFAANTVMEHPYKAAMVGQAGLQGREQQQKDLGDLPSYERGLLKLGGSKDHPLVADFSTFSPFATPADIADVASVGQASSFLNPVWAAGLQLATRQNSSGQHTNSPITDALGQLFAPTPEAQILAAYRNRGKNQNRKMFHTTPGSALARALIGPGTPRKLNRSAANRSAGLERSGR